MKTLIKILCLSVLWFSCENPTEPEPQDTEAPIVVITFPVAESQLTETTTIRVEVSDESPITKVIFLIDGISVFEDIESPYEYEWDICLEDGENHSILVRAEDEFGNQGQTDAMPIQTNGVYDCYGICGGNIFDADDDGICDDVDECPNDASNDEDSDGICDDIDECVGEYDECGECNGDGVDEDGDGSCDDIDDCIGEYDACEICNGNNFTCTDCAGVVNGYNELDNCGVCDSNMYNDCEQDCLGNWGGDLVYDACGVCGGENNNCVLDIDGNGYTTVILGDQEWLAENLKVTRYNNGDKIPTDISDLQWGDINYGAYGVYNDDLANTDIWGNLYNWYVVDDSRGVCPEGWHVPTDEEFMQLEIFLGMSYEEASEYGYRGTNEGSKLAGFEELWSYGDILNDWGFNTSNFDAKPAGARDGINGMWTASGYFAEFWTSTAVIYRDLNNNSTKVYRSGRLATCGHQIRCVKNK